VDTKNKKKKKKHRELLLLKIFFFKINVTYGLMKTVVCVKIVKCLMGVIPCNHFGFKTLDLIAYNS